LTDMEGHRRLYGDRIGKEIMVWTAGGHYFRGVLHEIDNDGFLVINDASCTLAGERHERDRVFLNVESVDAVS
jgi:small nuclear ribonucleoprotein (snRNP)-like protein